MNRYWSAFVWSRFRKSRLFSRDQRVKNLSVRHNNCRDGGRVLVYVSGGGNKQRDYLFFDPSLSIFPKSCFFRRIDRLTTTAPSVSADARFSSALRARRRVETATRGCCAPCYTSTVDIKVQFLLHRSADLGPAESPLGASAFLFIRTQLPLARPFDDGDGWSFPSPEYSRRGMKRRRFCILTQKR